MTQSATLLVIARAWLIAALAAAPGDLLTNGDFADAGPGLAAGWELCVGSGEGTAVRRAASGADEGAYVELTMATQGQLDIRPKTGFVALQPDTAYLLTAAIKTSNANDGSHAAELQWFGPDGFISLDAAAATVADKWARVAVGPVKPPDGATRVIVLLRGYDVGTYGFDSVALWEAAPMPASILRNPGFESDGDGDGVPDAWTPWGDAASADAQGAKSGQINARTGAASGWRQFNVPVIPSAKYELSAATRADEFGREFRLAIEWLTVQGDAISANEMKDQTWKAWQAKTLRAIAPADAARATLVLENMGEGTVWFDDVALTERGLRAEITLRLDAPNAQGLIRDGIDARTVRAVCAMKTDDDDFILYLRLVDAQGAVLAEAKPDWDNGEITWQPDASQLTVGAYRIVAEAIRAGGDAPVASEEVCLDIVPADAPGLSFRKDHIALLDGEPWFPIGVTSFSPTSAAAVSIAEAGFNLLLPGSFTNGEPGSVQAVLAKAEQLGIYVMEWNDGHVYGNLPSAERYRRFADSAQKIAGHHRFLGWLCDEALWNGIPLTHVRDGYLAARAAAPSLVFWQNQAPRNSVADIARYSRWSDVTGVDIYPVEGGGHSDLPNKTLSVVGDEVDKQHQTVDHRKPVWAILQGAGWGAWEKDPAAHKRAPNWAETRFMAYDAILHGATGIVYWGGHYEDQQSDIWHSLRRMARELADLSPALVAQERPAVTVERAPPGAGGGGVIVTARRVNGKLWIIAVNETNVPVQAAIAGLAGATRFERFAEDGVAITVQDGVLRDAFDPWGVHVYREP